MKKIISVAALLIGFLFVSCAIAETVAGYQSTQISIHPDKTMVLPPTAINVINLSQERIFIDYPVSFDIPEGTGRSVTHPAFYGDTRIVLLDWHRNVFFDQYVCHHAIVSVSGQPGYYYTKVDTERC